MSTSWTGNEKKELLKLLQIHGASNLDLIQRRMPHKTISEIRYICDKHRKLALNKWCLEEDQKPKETQAVNNWLYVLKQIKSSRNGPVQDIIPRVLKYIALYEKRAENSHISLRDCYLVLSDISNGLASKNLDEVSNLFFFECLTKLAEALKNGEIGSFKDCLKKLTNIQAIINSKPVREGINSEGTSGSTTLNPLNIPTSLLKMSEVDKMGDILE